MKRVLMVSPHFPPDSSAASHRLRLLAPHLPEFGWEPTIVTVDSRDYEGRLDPSLESLIPSSLRVVRVRALPARWTRLVRLGDLGLRSLPGLWRTCRWLLANEKFECLFVTIFPSYPALLGPLLKKRAKVTFVLDYQDPWVGSWGLSTGGGRNGTPDIKARISRAIGTHLEPIAVRAADGVTAVSEETFRSVQGRITESCATPSIAIPIGGEPSDFDHLRSHEPAKRVFDPADGHFHMSYVGTLLPMGLETLHAFLGAVARLKAEAPEKYRRLRVHFIGTSNQTTGVDERVLPEVRRLGVEEVIHELPARLDYLDALDVLVRSHAILLLGSSEKHYTASKLFPALLARRPILAIFHAESSVVAMLRSAEHAARQLVTYDDRDRAGQRVGIIYESIQRLMDESPHSREVDSDFPPDLSARALALRLSEFLDRVAAASTP